MGGNAWANISAEAKDFVKQLLTKCPPPPGPPCPRCWSGSLGQINLAHVMLAHVMLGPVIIKQMPFASGMKRPVWPAQRNIVLAPDPLLATRSTVKSALQHKKNILYN